MKITLYTIHCPACNVLKKKLDAAGIEYTLVDDINVLNNLGYKVFPILNVDGKDFNLSQANQWLKERI